MGGIYTILKKKKRIRVAAIILELFFAISCILIAILGLLFQGGVGVSVLFIAIGLIIEGFIIWFAVFNRLPDKEILKEVNAEFDYNNIRFKLGLSELYLTPHFLILSQGGMLSIVRRRDIISMFVKKEGAYGMGTGFSYTTHVIYVVTKTKKYSANVGNSNRDRAEQFIELTEQKARDAS